MTKREQVFVRLVGVRFCRFRQKGQKKLWLVLIEEVAATCQIQQIESRFR